MEAAYCLGLLGEVRSLSFATVDQNGEAQVRIVDVTYMEEGIYFVTARGKDFYRELCASAKVGVVGMTGDWKMIRLNAKVKKLDRAYVDLLFEKMGSIKDVYPGDSRRIMEAFCLESGHGELFDLGEVPVKRESFAFGGEKIRHKGYEIDDTCIACGVCADACPQSCIDSGETYFIRKENCLHCGLCSEVCPADAVVRR